MSQAPGFLCQLSLASSVTTGKLPFLSLRLFICKTHTVPQHFLIRFKWCRRWNWQSFTGCSLRSQHCRKFYTLSRLHSDTYHVIILCPHPNLTEEQRYPEVRHLPVTSYWEAGSLTQPCALSHRTVPGTCKLDKRQSLSGWRTLNGVKQVTNVDATRSTTVAFT